MVCPTRDKKLAFVCGKELKVLDIVEESEEEKAKEDNSDDVEHLGATDLPSCVIHRVFTGTKQEFQDDLDWLRTNIFHTHMAHEWRVLNIIIDNDIKMNVISGDAFEHLGLKVKKHLTLYQVSWVNEDKPILVKHLYLMKFSLRKKYTDKACCDIFSHDGLPLTT